MVNRDKVFAYEFDGYWQDIGTAQSYYWSNMELLQKQPSFTLNTSKPVLTDIDDLPPSKISPQGSVSNSLVSPGCVIKGHVENSVLSPGVKVEEQAVVRDSIVMTNSTIGYHSIIDRCILDEEVSIGQFCYIGLGKSLLSGDWDITVVGRRVIVPPHTAIGRDCRVLPHVGPHDFPAKAIPSGTVISHR
jgi:glucose-1-phosphate adenylyltransferase